LSLRLLKIPLCPLFATQAGAFITGQIIPVDGGTSVIN
jgi:hypothetical protein